MTRKVVNAVRKRLRQKSIRLSDIWKEIVYKFVLLFSNSSTAISLNVSVFRTRSLHLSLTRNNIMMAVVDLIDQYYGGVTALSMKVFIYVVQYSQKLAVPKIVLRRVFTQSIIVFGLCSDKGCNEYVIM